ncbi:histidine kinase [Paenibacillus paeoniae]|uniref:Response regulator n=1 Tax=Paenibacillus paeoniae TaxID=2292705 RepID=A0A371PKA5_9BACL|nr:histidine kinase [Paenibacillus paeoniae]REK76632.1 response regulator [Paenibacillus paeoniae]
MVVQQKRSIACSTYCLVILFAVVLLVAASAMKGRLKESSPVPVEGVLQLGDWNLQEDGRVSLSGEWTFYWNRLLTSDDFLTDESKPGAGSIVRVPQAWSQSKLDGLKPGRKGYATYRLQIQLQTASDVLALKIPVLPTAYEVMANGKTIAEAGNVSVREENAVAAYHPQTVFFKPQSTMLDLIVHISNYTERDGGMVEGFELGSSDNMRMLREQELAGTMFFLGSAIMISLYYFYTWIVYGFVPAALYYSLLCMLAAVRMLVIDHMFILQLVPGLSVGWLTFLDSLSLYGGIAIAILFIHQLFPNEFNRSIMKALTWVGMLFNLTLVAGALHLNPAIRMAFYVYIGAAGSYMLFMLMHAIRSGREGAMARLTGLLICVMALTHDYLLNYQMNILFNKPIMYYVIFLLIFMEMIDFSKRFLKPRLPRRIRSPDEPSSARETVTEETAAKPNKEAMELAATKSEQGSSSALHILAVDEDSCWLRLIHDTLTDERYKVASVMNGAEALAHIDHSRRLDIVLLNGSVSGMSGIELVRRIRSRYSHVELPIVMMSFKEGMMDIREGFQAGVNDFLLKPFHAQELQARIDMYLEMKQLAESAATSEIAMLQAEIKPHFLYNTLNTALSLTLEEPQKAHDLLLKLSYYLRNSIQMKHTSKFIGLSEEIELVKSYLFIEKARFGHRLHIEYDIDDSLDITVPPLIIQPIMENAVKHGVTQKMEGGKVKLTARADNGYLIIIVEDNGAGMAIERVETLLHSDNKSGGMALINIHQRLLLIYGQGLSIWSELGQGTKVEIRIPEPGMDWT